MPLLTDSVMQTLSGEFLDPSCAASKGSFQLYAWKLPLVRLVLLVGLGKCFYAGSPVLCILYV